MAKKFWQNIRDRIARLSRMHCWRICLRQIPLQIEEPELPEGLVFEALDHAQMRLLAAHHPGVSAEFVENAIEQDDTCLIVRRTTGEQDWQDQVMGFSWRTQEAVDFVPELSVGLLQQQTFFGFKTWIEPEVRGLRLFEKMRQYQDIKSAALGTAQGIAYINLTNTSSWASMRRDVHYRQVGFLVFAEWGPLSWSLTSPGAAKWVKVN